jgi:acyl-CoA thioester hydrolase
LARLRFSDFDLGGVLHHSNYLKLCEELREAWLRASGLPYSTLVDRGYHIAVVSAEQEFLKPIAYDNSVIGEVEVASIGRTSFSVKHRLLSKASPELLFSKALVRLVLVKRVDGSFKPERLIDELLKILRP